MPTGNVRVTEMTAETAPESTDLLYLVKADGSAYRRVSVANLLGASDFDWSALTTETAPDYILGIKDGGLVKVPVSNC